MGPQSERATNGNGGTVSDRRIWVYRRRRPNSARWITRPFYNGDIARRYVAGTRRQRRARFYGTGYYETTGRAATIERKPRVRVFNDDRGRVRSRSVAILKQAMDAGKRLGRGAEICKQIFRRLRYTAGEPIGRTGAPVQTKRPGIADTVGVAIHTPTVRFAKSGMGARTSTALVLG